MPTNITPASAWTTPIVTPSSGDGATAASVAALGQPLADRVEFIKDKALGGVTSWPRTSVAKKVAVAGASFTGSTSKIIVSGGAIFAQLSDNSCVMIKDLNPYVFSGMILTGVDSVVNAGDGSNALRTEIVYQPHDYATPANEPKAYLGIGLGKNASGAGKQRITQTGGTHVVDLTSNDYFYLVTAGASAGTPGTYDYVYGMQLILTDPGGLRT